MHRSRIVAALAALAASAGCSSTPEAQPQQQPVQPAGVVRLDGGTIGGSGWTLVTFRNEAGEICLELRDAGMQKSPDLSGGCGPWNDNPTGGRFMDGKGPGRSEFAYGLLTDPAVSVTATAAGHDPVTVPAKAMPAGTGAAKFFVIAFPEPDGAWTYAAKDATGAPVRLGP